MNVFIAKRLATFLLTMLGTSVIIFIVMEILPGDPALTILGVDAPDSAVEALREKLGLNRPAPERYVDWFLGFMTGDLGMSYTYSVPVSELVGASLYLTIPLALLSMAVTIIIAVAMGVYAAANHNKVGDYGVMGFSQLGIAVPNFWFGILLILLLAVELQWFRSGGFPGWERDFFGSIKALILPAIALATVQAAILTRVTRSAVLEVSREDFVRTARAKGLSRRSTLWGHVLRNAMIPMVTIMGVQFANLLAGTIVIESVFSLPGIGRLIFQSISNRDLVVVMSMTMMLAAMVITVNFVVDLLYAAIDPRIRVND
jgi:peptide/nickel transport system permease protein